MVERCCQRFCSAGRKVRSDNDFIFESDDDLVVKKLLVGSNEIYSEDTNDRNNITNAYLEPKSRSASSMNKCNLNVCHNIHHPDASDLAISRLSLNDSSKQLFL